MNLNNDLLPHLSRDGKIINLSAGGNSPQNLLGFDSPACKELNDPNITEYQLRVYITDFMMAVEEGQLIEKGWENCAYICAKSFLNIYTSQVLTKQIETGQQVCSVDPGYVKYGIVLTNDNKANDIFYLIDLEFETDFDSKYQGKFFRYREVVQ